MATENEPTRYFSTPQVAKMFDVTTGTVRTWIREKRLKAVKLPGGRQWKVSQEELERFAKVKVEM